MKGGLARPREQLGLNRILTYSVPIQSLFSPYSVEQGIVNENPMHGIRKPTERLRVPVPLEILNERNAEGQFRRRQKIIRPVGIETIHCPL
jgi:hypothetical protein